MTGPTEGKATESAGSADADAAASNPYQYRSDEELETFARGVIDDAMAKTASSPRQFAYYSMMAAKRIAQFVLARFVRKSQ